MNTQQIIALARKHLMDCPADRMVSSAELCLSDALRLYELGDYTNAKARATKCLAYTVGVFHPSYRMAAA